MALRLPTAVLLGSVALLLGLLFAVTSPASPGRAVTNCSTSSASLNAAEQEMLRLHNEERARHGLSPLTTSQSLNRAAAWKSEDSSASGAEFSHTDSLGRSPSARAQDCGYSSGAAENIAHGYQDARATFDAWMDSPGHRNNILNPSYRAIGIGASGSSWTTNFGFSVESGGSPDPTATSTTAPATSTPRPATSTPTAVPSTSTPVPATTTPTSAPAESTATPAAAPPTATPEATTAPGQQSRSLSAGITILRFQEESVRVEESVASIADEMIFIYHYDSEQGRWLRYLPGEPSFLQTLTWLRPGELYFVGLQQDATWSWE